MPPHSLIKIVSQFDLLTMAGYSRMITEPLVPLLSRGMFLDKRPMWSSPIAVMPLSLAGPYRCIYMKRPEPQSRAEFEAAGSKG
jgi:hypothetical protein